MLLLMAEKYRATDKRQRNAEKRPSPFVTSYGADGPEAYNIRKINAEVPVNVIIITEKILTPFLIFT